MLQVGRRARVTGLNRPTPKDRTAYEDRDGLLIRRLNVPWEPDVGSLWEVRFDDGEVVVFSESELVMLDASGDVIPSDLEDMKQAWGVAPRTVSYPFRRFGSGTGSAPAILALVVFAVAGVLLIWAGISSGTALLALAGAVLVLIGIGAAAFLVT